MLVGGLTDRRASLATPSGDTAVDGSSLDRLKILKNRNFGLLWVGGLVAMLGDGFTLVAFPWLVIQLSNSALALGSVLAVRMLPGIPD